MSKAKAERKSSELSKANKVNKANKVDMVKEVKDSLKPKKYITYFQSVTTIGIVSSGETPKEAQAKSELKMKNASMAYSVIAHEPFTASATDQWEPSNV
jgi:hypothetical protein